MGIIYKYTSPEQKSYIGQTKYNMKKRAGVNGQDYKTCRYFYNAIKKYGFENFKAEVIEECADDKLNEREVYWIKYYNTLVPNGYNITEGGTNAKSWSKTVYQYDQDGTLVHTYESLSEAAMLNNCNIGSLSEVCSGRKSTCFGYFWSYENTPPQRPQKNFRNKRVYQFDDEGNLIKRFANLKEAAAFYDVPRYKICFCCRKTGVKRVNGMIFSYKPYVEWEYYTLKHKPSSTTIPNQGVSPSGEKCCAPQENADEDIVLSRE